MPVKIVWRNGVAQAYGTVGGKRIRQSLETSDPKRAEEAVAQIEARAWTEKVYGSSSVVMFEDAALSYMEQGGEARYLVRPLRHFKGVRLGSILPGHVKAAAIKLLPNCSPATQRRQVICPVVAVINHGHQNGWCGAMKVKFATGKTPTRKAVDRDYIDALRSRCMTRAYPAPHLAALMLFVHQTGARIGEAMKLEPQDVDLGKGTAIAYDTKNGEDRLIHLTEEIIEDLRTLPPRSGRVFGYIEPKSVYRTLRKVCKEAGLEYLGTHQAGRHSFATALDAEGFSASSIAAAGGWKSVALVQKTYIHPENAGKQAAAVMGSKRPIGTKLTHPASELSEDD